MHRWLLAIVIGAPLGAMAQSFILADAALHVADGTTLRIASPLAWQLLPGAVVVNDGLIDFGTEAFLSEQPGTPITGSGIERAVWPLASPLAAAGPGNLGLTLSTAYSNGGFTMERGHLAAHGALGKKHRSERCA